LAHRLYTGMKFRQYLTEKGLPPYYVPLAETDLLGTPSIGASTTHPKRSSHDSRPTDVEQSPEGEGRCSHHGSGRDRIGDSADGPRRKLTPCPSARRGSRSGVPHESLGDGTVPKRSFPHRTTGKVGPRGPGSTLWRASWRGCPGRTSTGSLPLPQADLPASGIALQEGGESAKY
jgi:hypothetical protein